MSALDYEDQSAVAQDQSAVAQLFAEFGGAELPLNNHPNKLAASLVVYTGCCYMTSITVANTNVAAQYIQIFDARALPADGAAPDVLLQASGATDKFLSYSLPGRFFKTGIVVCNSSTAGTKTIGAADCFFDVQYIPVIL